MGGLFFIMFDEENIENRTDQLINDISNCNNEHKIQCYNVTQYNTPK